MYGKTTQKCIYKNYTKITQKCMCKTTQKCIKLIDAEKKFYNFGPWKSFRF